MVCVSRIFDNVSAGAATEVKGSAANSTDSAGSAPERANEYALPALAKAGSRFHMNSLLAALAVTGAAAPAFPPCPERCCYGGAGAPFSSTPFQEAHGVVAAPCRTGVLASSRRLALVILRRVLNLRGRKTGLGQSGHARRVSGHGGGTRFSKFDSMRAGTKQNCDIQACAKEY